MTHRPLPATKILPALALGALVFAPLLLTPRLAAAQSAPPSAASGDDPAGIVTLQDDNSSISSARLTDRYYVNGLRAGYTTPTGALPAWMSGLGRTLWGDGKQRISFDLTQQIYTPDNTAAAIPPAGDRPYAGVLMGTVGLVQDTDTTRSTFSLGLGMVGPAALGKQIQNGFHDLIGQGHDAGWDDQIHNEPLIEITSSRVWRLNLGDLAGMQTQALPQLTAGVGNLRVYALTGAVFRIGQGLDTDYGVARPSPGLSGGDAFTPTQPFVWYVFAGFDGQGVAHDITIDGNTFQSSPSAKRQPWVGEGEAGIALEYHGARLTYTQVVQSAEIRHQKDGLHQFGSLALSVRF